MIKAQRKYHRQIWMLWALLLPAGIILGWIAVPNQLPVKLLKNETPSLLTEVVRIADGKNYMVVLRSDKEKTNWQLEWKNKSVLEYPSAVIYNVTGVNGDIKKGKIVGRIETKGDYVFQLPADSSGYSSLQLLLYDFIHDQKIESINF